jgi:hypothetical protein
LPTEEEQLQDNSALDTDMTLEEKAEWFGVSLEGQKDVWYVIKRYRIRSKLWFMWPVCQAASFLIISAYIFSTKDKDAIESVAPCCWIILY